MSDKSTEKVVVAVRLPGDYAEQIDAICQSTGRTRSDVMIEAVELYLGKSPAPKVLSDIELLQERMNELEKKLLQSTNSITNG